MLFSLSLLALTACQGVFRSSSSVKTKCCCLLVYSQQGLQGSVGLQGIGQVSCPTDAGDDTQVEVELSERARLGDAAADSSKVTVGELAAADRQQPDAVLLQTLTDVLNLGR